MRQPASFAGVARLLYNVIMDTLPAHPNIWQGRLVRLRAVEPGDAETHWAWDLDSDAARRAYRVPFPASREQTRRWAEDESLRGAPNDTFRFQIENIDGTLVGTLNTHSCDLHHGTFSYGVAVASEYQRRGYASEAILLVLRYFFSELRYQKATAYVYSFNEPSIALHERLGFQREGCVRRRIYTQGRYWDELIFGITVEEWAARYGG
jgi:RimJ/RimL family protein N-acetyltransferase